MRPSEELAKIDVDVWVKWWTDPTRTRRDHEKDGDRCVENLAKKLLNVENWTKGYRCVENLPKKKICKIGQSDKKSVYIL